ncbi:hypothetical protein E2320_003382, partial [Naja naja]
NGKWRWSDESTYNYKAWMLGKPNLRTKEYCVELVRPVHGANVPKYSYHQYEEAPIRNRKAQLCPWLGTTRRAPKRKAKESTSKQEILEASMVGDSRNLQKSEAEKS